MNVHVWSKDVKPDQLLETIKSWEGALSGGDDYRLIITWWNRPSTFASLDEGLKELAAEPGASDSGTAFGPAAELRWRRMDQFYRLVISSEQDLALDGEAEGGLDWQHEILNVAASEVQQHLLWGSDWQEGSERWSELRIPRSLRYPVSPGKSEWDSARIQITIYKDEQGKSLLARRIGMLAFSIKGAL